jgi:hypothetical protein
MRQKMAFSPCHALLQTWRVKRFGVRWCVRLGSNQQPLPSEGRVYGKQHKTTDNLPYEKCLFWCEVVRL